MGTAFTAAICYVILQFHYRGETGKRADIPDIQSHTPAAGPRVCLCGACSLSSATANQPILREQVREVRSEEGEKKLRLGLHSVQSRTASDDNGPGNRKLLTPNKTSVTCFLVASGTIWPDSTAVLQLWAFFEHFVVLSKKIWNLM